MRARLGAGTRERRGTESSDATVDPRPHGSPTRIRRWPERGEILSASIPSAFRRGSHVEAKPPRPPTRPEQERSSCRHDAVSAHIKASFTSERQYTSVGCDRQRGHGFFTHPHLRGPGPVGAPTVGKPGVDPGAPVVTARLVDDRWRPVSRVWIKTYLSCIRRPEWRRGCPERNDLVQAGPVWPDPLPAAAPASGTRPTAFLRASADDPGGGRVRSGVP